MMERIKYRFSLDTHRTGIQKTLQGFYSPEVGRALEINLTANGDTLEIPAGVVANLYLNNGEDIIPCEIDGNTIICNIDNTAPGKTEAQLKILEGFTRAEVLILAPKFAIETWDADGMDDEAMDTDKFSALDQALVRANTVYNTRITRFEVDDELTIRVWYADGSVYESTKLHELYAMGDNAVSHFFAEMSKSWAVGGTGLRDGEDTDNSEYYSKVSNSHAEEAHAAADNGAEILQECREHSIYTKFDVDFETGNLTYMSQNYTFRVDDETGNLIVETAGEWTPDEITRAALERYMAQYADSVSALAVQVAAMQGQIASKADSSALVATQDSLQAKINEKANNSTVDALNATVHGLSTSVESKADKTEVDTISGKVDDLESEAGVKNGSIAYVSDITSRPSIITSNLHVKKEGHIVVINGYIFFPSACGVIPISSGTPSQINLKLGTLGDGFKPADSLVIGRWFKTREDRVPISGPQSDVIRYSQGGLAIIQNNGEVWLTQIGIGEDNGRCGINFVFNTL